MRAMSPQLQAKLRAPTQSFAHIWRVTRADGVVLGFTDHDRDISFAGLACKAASGWRKGGAEHGNGLSIDADLIEAGLSSLAIASADIEAGLWDDATVETFLIDWAAPQHWIKLSAARFGEMTRHGSSFQVELRSAKAELNAPIGRVFSRSCDANLGDQRCGVDLANASFSASGQIATLISPVRFTVTGCDAFAAGWFTQGRARIGGGRWWDIAAHEVSGQAVTIELFAAPGAVLAPVVAITLVAGCDKRFATCRDKFANITNFRGFAQMPGNDVLAAIPAPGQVHDGGSRRNG